MTGGIVKEIESEDLELRRAALALSERQVALEEKKAEFALQLAQYGLKGTLIGTIGGMTMVLVLTILALLSPELGITGIHIIVMVGIIGSIVAMYGAFVFNRSASFVARLGEHSFRAGTTGRDSDPPKD